MKKIRLMMAVLLAAFSGYAGETEEVLLSMTFDEGGQTVGYPPSYPGLLLAQTPPLTAVTVMDSSANKVGTGNWVELIDASDSDFAKMEYNLLDPVTLQLQSQSVIRWDFTFSPLIVSGAGAAIQAGVAKANGNIGSGAQRFCSMRLYDNGTIRFYAGAASGGANIYSMAIGLGKAYKVSMFLNDLYESFPYVDPNGVSAVLPAKSVALWIEDVSLGANKSVYRVGGLLAFAGAAGSISGGTNDLGRIGFVSPDVGPSFDFAFDDIKVSKLSRPATPGTLSLYLLGD